MLLFIIFIFLKREMEKMTKILAFSTNKGGVLKTTLASSIAGVLSKQNKKILVIDLDNQGNVGVNFGQNPDNFEHTIYDVLLNDLNINDAIINVAPNIDIVPSNDDMSSFEMDILKKVLSDSSSISNPSLLLKNALANLTGNYDYVFLDTPPNMGVVVANALSVAENVILPFHPEVFSLRSMIKTLQAIENFKSINPNLSILGVVPTKVKKNTSLHNDSIGLCEGYCQPQGYYVTQTRIHETIQVPHAMARYQMPITLTNSKSKAISEFESLVKELKL